MKRLQIFLLALTIIGLAALYSCGQAPNEDEQQGQEQTREIAEEKAEADEDMVEKAEEMEGDTASKEEEAD